MKNGEEKRAIIAMVDRLFRWLFLPLATAAATAIIVHEVRIAVLETKVNDTSHFVRIREDISDLRGELRENWKEFSAWRREVERQLAGQPERKP